MKRLAALAVLMVAALAVPVPASGTAELRAEIVNLDPALPTTASTLTLSVQVTNPGNVEVTDLEAHFLISTAPLTGRSEIPEVLSGRLLPTYRLIDEPVASGIDLAGGTSTTLTLRTSARALGLDGPGAYLFGVELRGSAGGSRVTERPVTLLPWMPEAGGGSLGIVTVWTLTAPPTLDVDGTFVDDSLARAVSEGGRLRLQLDAMRPVQGAVWLVDPLLIEAVQALADGARIAQPAGGTRGATDAERQDATTWLGDVRTAVATGTLAALPLGDLDLRAAMKFGRIAVARAALATAKVRLASAMQVPAVPLVVPVYSGAVTDSVWKFLARAGATSAVASDQGYPVGQTQYTPNSAISVDAFRGPVIAADHILSSTPVTAGISGGAARQALAAHLLMTYLERPNSDRAITFAVPPTWVPDASSPIAPVLNATWLTHVTPARAAALGTDTRDVVNAVATKAQRLQDRDLGRAVEGQRFLAHITTDADFSSTVQTSVVGTLSRWFTARQTKDRYSYRTIARLEGLADSVRVVTRGDVVFAGEKGVVPVTVANGLPVPVDLVLQALGVPSARVQPLESTTVTVNAGKRVSVEIPTRVTGSGDAMLLLQLQAADRTPIDMPVMLTVRSAAYARVAGYLVLGAFALLILLVVANTVKRVRGRGQEAE